MNDKINLKPCPFCGGNNIVKEEQFDLVFCRDCTSETNGDDWNKRPGEDNLRAQLAVVLAKLHSFEEKSVIVKFMNEDELPEGITDDVYSAMFNCSHVEAVRLFPYVEDSDEKYFLILPEAIREQK